MIVRPPPQPLRPFVAGLGYSQRLVDHRQEKALPSATAQLLVNLDRDELHMYGERQQLTGGAALQGVNSGPALIDPAEQRELIWVAFRPVGVGSFFPAAATSDQLVDLTDLWGRAAGELRERLLCASTPHERLRIVEDELLLRLRGGLDPGVAAATAALHRGLPVALVADRLGWTDRTLRRYMLEQIGLSPKRFSRVRRFQRLLQAVSSGQTRDWAELAADHGYYDQAHLIHEFHVFAGMRPTEYLPAEGARNHVPILTSAAGDRPATIAV